MALQEQLEDLRDVNSQTQPFEDDESSIDGANARLDRDQTMLNENPEIPEDGANADAFGEGLADAHNTRNVTMHDANEEGETQNEGRFTFTLPNLGEKKKKSMLTRSKRREKH